ncbi:MAG: AMP-binding protein, partial [Prevotella shahii]
MAMFLYDGEQEYSYDNLMSTLHQPKEYYPYYKNSILFSLLENLIKALITNQPIVLLDADINVSELKGIDEECINKAVSLPGFHFENIDDVIAALQTSTSTITIFTSGTTGQPKQVVHSIGTLTRSVRIGEKYQGQVWAYAYNPTHMAGLQVFFQAFENKNTLVNVFNNGRKAIYQKLEKYHITHISATPTFYRLLLPAEKSFDTVLRATLGGEKSDSNLHEEICKLFPLAKINNVYASTEAGTLFAAKGEYFQIPKQNRGLFRVDAGELLIHHSLLGKSDGFSLDGDYY